MSIITQERETYEAIWSLGAYAEHSPGAQHVSLFLDMIPHKPGRWHAHSVLDAGCGSGKGALALQQAGFSVTMCDLTDAGLSDEARALPFHRVELWSPLKRAVGFHDWVYCCDVMEHIPPAFTMLVVARLLEVARRGAFFSISLVPDQFGAWVGKPLHQSVWSFVEWRDQLDTIGRVVEARDLLATGVYLVEPRC